MYEHNPQVTVVIEDTCDIVIPPKGEDRNVDVELVIHRGLRIKDLITGKYKFSGDIITDGEAHLVEDRLGLPNVTNDIQTVLGNIGNRLYNINEDLTDPDKKYIGDGGRDVYDNGNYIYINGNQMVYNKAFDVLNQKMMVANINFSNLPALTAVTEFKVEGGTGADGGGGIMADTNVKVTINGADIYVSYKIIHNGTGDDPTINHLVISKNPIASHSYASNTDNDHDIYTFDNGEVAVAMIYWGVNTGDIYLGYANLQEMLTAMLSGVAIV